MALVVDLAVVVDLDLASWLFALIVFDVLFQAQRRKSKTECRERSERNGEPGATWLALAPKLYCLKKGLLISALSLLFAVLSFHIAALLDHSSIFNKPHRYSQPYLIATIKRHVIIDP